MDRRRHQPALRLGRPSDQPGRTAGATGFIFADDEERFAAGITGSATIPGVLVAKSGGDAIRAQLAANKTVTIGSTTSNGFTQIDEALNDTLAGFSSRGIRGAGNVKPDVTAVGVSVFSAGNGTGDQGLNDSGTSMATPMVAGTAALVKSEHANWVPEQVKADIMNTANQDLYVDPNHEGAKYAPNRVGAGRIDIKQAVDNTVLAYVKDDPGVVSVSFGPVEATADTAPLSKTITVQNTSLTSATYAVELPVQHQHPGCRLVGVAVIGHRRPALERDGQGHADARLERSSPRRSTRPSTVARAATRASTSPTRAVWCCSRAPARRPCGCRPTPPRGRRRR